MEKSTPIGLIAGIGLILLAIGMGGGWATFINAQSFLIVFGGTAAALLVSYNFRELKTIGPGLLAFFRFERSDPSLYVRDFSELSWLSRREGLFAVDRRLNDIDDPLMSFGLEMAVDGIDEEEIGELLENRSDETVEPSRLLERIFSDAGTYAPAFGMVGTLIGLIQMLRNLQDPSTIGPAMAVALITTFYGALLANLVFFPMAAKLKQQIIETRKAHMLITIGVVSIVKGDNPSMVEKRLEAFALEAYRNTDHNTDRHVKPVRLSRAA